MFGLLFCNISIVLPRAWTQPFLFIASFIHGAVAMMSSTNFLFHLPIIHRLFTIFGEIILRSLQQQWTNLCTYTSPHVHVLLPWLNQLASRKRVNCQTCLYLSLHAPLLQVLSTTCVPMALCSSVIKYTVPLNLATIVLLVDHRPPYYLALSTPPSPSTHIVFVPAHSTNKFLAARCCDFSCTISNWFSISWMVFHVTCDDGGVIYDAMFNGTNIRYL